MGETRGFSEPLIEALAAWAIEGRLESRRVAAVGVVLLGDDVDDALPLMEDVFEVEGVDAREVLAAAAEIEGRAWVFGVIERGAGPDESGDLSLRGLTPASAREDFRCVDLVGVATVGVVLGLLVEGVGVDSPGARREGWLLLAGEKAKRSLRSYFHFLLSGTSLGWGGLLCRTAQCPVFGREVPRAARLLLVGFFDGTHDWSISPEYLSGSSRYRYSGTGWAVTCWLEVCWLH